MAENGGKPNNELFELNDLLAGVEPSEESLEDIMAEVYGKKPDTDAPAPPPEESPEPIPEEDAVPEGPILVSSTPWKVSEPEEVPIPPVVRDDDEEQPDVLSDPEPPKRGRGKLLAFPGAQVPQEPEEEESDAPEEEQPDSPSAWVEPKPGDLPPVLIDAALEDEEEEHRPDGFTPGKRPKIQELKQAAVDRREDYRAKLEPEEEPEPSEDGSEKQPGRLAKLRARLDRFSDSMFSQAATTDEDTEMAERYIPGTDEEAQTEPPKKVKRPKRVIPPAEDLAPQLLSRIYYTGLNFMNHRVVLLFLLSFVSGYLAIAGDTRLPLPGPLATDPRMLAAVELLLLGWAIVFSLDVIWMGLHSLKDWMLTLHTVADVAVFFTVIDALVYCLAGRNGPAPYCAPATLILFCLTWGSYDKKLANYRASRQAAFSQEPQRLTKDEKLWNARDTFTKERGDARDFGSQIQAPNGAELMQARLAPIILLASVLLAFLASVGHSRPEQFLWCLSAILISASPLSALLCYGQPWLRLTRRLEKCGAAVAGWPGVRASAGNAGVLITDLDLFPTGTVQFNGIKVYGDISLEKLVGCAASLIRVSGSGLSDLFDGLVRTQGGFYRRVDDFQCYEAGGLSGNIRGEQIMVGSAAFMTVMDVPLPQDLKVKNAVFCAIDGSLRGIFALNYAKTNTVRPAMVSLLRSKLIPVLVPRDFNVTPAMVRQKLKIPVEKMEYPPVERRLELTEPEQDHDITLCALLSRENVESYADTIVGCRRLRSTVRSSSILCLAASFVGLALSYYLTTVQAFVSLTPTNVLLFLALWLIPTLLISGNVNRY